MYSQSTSTAPSHFQPAILSSLQGSSAPQLQGLTLWAHFSGQLCKWLLNMYGHFYRDEQLNAKAKSDCQGALYLVYDSAVTINHEALHAINAIHAGTTIAILPAPLRLASFTLPEPAGDGHTIAPTLLGLQLPLTALLQEVSDQLPTTSPWKPLLKNLLTTYKKMCAKARQL